MVFKLKNLTTIVSHMSGPHRLEMHVLSCGCRSPKHHHAAAGPTECVAVLFYFLRRIRSLAPQFLPHTINGIAHTHTHTTRTHSQS